MQDPVRKGELFALAGRVTRCGHASMLNVLLFVRASMSPTSAKRARELRKEGSWELRGWKTAR